MRRVRIVLVVTAVVVTDVIISMLMSQRVSLLDHLVVTC